MQQVIIMIIEMLLIWILIFIVFLVVNITQKSHNFGILAGIWILLIGCFIILEGVQISSGVEITDTANSQIVTYDYEDVTLPYSTYSFVWGIIFILLGVYIMYANLI